MKGNQFVIRSSSDNSRRPRFVVACIAIFLLALTVRAFHWQDNPVPPFHGMTGEYKAHAMVLVDGDLKGFLRGPNPPSDANVVKHPPGYPLLMAAVYKLSGNSDNALRFVHILLDVMAALLVFLIAYELFSFLIATISGVLIAVSPQLAYHSVALLPDALAAPTLLFAVYLLVRAYKNKRLLTLFAAGLMVGVSCWLRSNALLLPLFVCATAPILFQRVLRLRAAAALLAGFLLLVVPVTIRNAIYFRSFIPLSLSAGITLVEGIGVYDREKRFGLPDSDYLVSKWEAEIFQRPDYLANRFGVDGVMRERYRVKRGLAVVAQHPLWFSRVMIERAGSMLRLARVELIRPQPAVTHSLSVATAPTDSLNLATANRIPSASVLISPTTNSEALRVEDPNRGFVTLGPFAIKQRTDYLLRIPLKIEHGGVVIEALDAERNTTLAFTPVLYPVTWLDLTEKNQPVNIVELSFVSGDANSVAIRLRSRAAPLALEAGSVQVFELGAASQTWTRYPRVFLNAIQRLFITAVMLPFTLWGIVVLVRRRRWPELAILTVVPLYYMCVQSALWTEFRYILSMHYFLFILAAVGFTSIMVQVMKIVGSQRSQRQE